jgi:hypothetical protein
LLAAASFAITVYRWPRKALGWELLIFDPMIEAASESSAKVEIGGHKFKATDVDFVLIEVLNTGNRDIEEDHYQRPLNFDFGDKAQVLSAEVLYENPQDPPIRAALSHTTNSVTLEPVLLNAGEMVGIKVLVANSDAFRWDGRITGVTKIKHISPVPRVTRLVVLLTVIMILHLVSSFSGSGIFPTLFTPAAFGVTTGLVVIGAITGLVLVYRQWRQTKRRLTLLRQSGRPRH